MEAAKRIDMERKRQRLDNITRVVEEIRSHPWATMVEQHADKSDLDLQAKKLLKILYRGLSFEDCIRHIMEAHPRVIGHILTTHPTLREMSQEPGLAPYASRFSIES